MRKYVIAWISFHNNELQQKAIEALDELDALKCAFLELGFDYEADGEKETVESIKQYAFDCDGMVAALEVS